MGLVSSIGHPPSLPADSRKLELPRRPDVVQLLKMQADAMERTGNCLPRRDEHLCFEEMGSLRRSMLS